MMLDDDTLYVEVTLPSGSIARWAVPCDLHVGQDAEKLDALTDAIEAILGQPDTLLT